MYPSALITRQLFCQKLNEMKDDHDQIDDTVIHDVLTLFDLTFDISLGEDDHLFFIACVMLVTKFNSVIYISPSERHEKEKIIFMEKKILECVHYDMHLVTIPRVLDGLLECGIIRKQDCNAYLKRGRDLITTKPIPDPCEVCEVIILKSVFHSVRQDGEVHTPASRREAQGNKSAYQNEQEEEVTCCFEGKRMRIS